MPVRTITYSKKKKPSWLVFKDEISNRSCAVITNSKYEQLQIDRWCIPFSGKDDELKGSYGPAAATEQFPEHKICKKGSKEQPTTGSREDYCKSFEAAIQSEAVKNKWISLSKICDKKPGDKIMKEYCGYLY